MARSLYAVTALADGKPVGAFVIASDADEAASRATARLPDGKLTHIVEFCEARISTLKRNGLLACFPESERVEFLTETLLQIVDAQSKQIATLRTCIESLTGTLVEKLGLRQFAFTVIEGRTGIVQLHECFAPDPEQAKQEAERFTNQHYGDGAIVQKVREIPKR